MTLWIGLRNLRVRAVATVLTVLVVAVATAIALVVPITLRQLDRGATEAAQVFDLLITAKGSPTQAVLSSLFYLDVPIGNLPYDRYEALAADPRTRRAVPLGFGDNFRGYPVVGTNAHFFEQRLTASGPPYFQLRDGEAFTLPFEAVLGARVAQATGLGVGDVITTAHGYIGAPPGTGGPAPASAAEHEHEHDDHAEHEHEHAEQEHEHAEHEHADTYVVVGVLQPTGGPVDQAVLVDIESLWLVHGQFTPDQRGVTAILYTAERLPDYYAVAQEVDATPDAQAVFTGAVFAQMRGFVSQGEAAYGALSLLVLVLATLTLWLNIYAGALERRRSVGLLRALGAGRPLIFALVMLETGLTVGIGLVLGVGLSYALTAFGGGVLGATLGFVLPAPVFEPGLLLRVLLLLPLAWLAALVPAIQAMRESPLRYV